MAKAKSGFPLKRWLLIGLAILLLIVIVQNSETVETHVLFVTMRMPRFVLLGLMALLGFAIGVFAARRPKTKVEVVERAES